MYLMYLDILRVISPNIGIPNHQLSIDGLSHNSTDCRYNWTTWVTELSDSVSGGSIISKYLLVNLQYSLLCDKGVIVLDPYTDSGYYLILILFYNIHLDWILIWFIIISLITGINTKYSNKSNILHFMFFHVIT